MTEVLHHHDGPSFGLMADAERAHRRGDIALADQLVRPWSCCITGAVLLISGHLDAAQHMAAYAGRTLVYMPPALAPDVDPEQMNRWVQGHHLRDHFLSGETGAGVEGTARAIIEDHDMAPIMLTLAVQAFTEALALTPGGTDAHAPAIPPSVRP